MAEISPTPEARDVSAFEWELYRPMDLPPVLAKSLDAFVEHGYHGTTVRDIAGRLKQTVPTIYYYYENKQALLVALLNISIDDLLERCRLADLSAPAEPARRLSALIRSICLFVLYRRQLALLDEEVRSLEPRNRDSYIAKRDSLEAMLVSCIDDGVAVGAFMVDDPRAASRALLSMCRGIAGWHRPRGPLTPEGIAGTYERFALGLVGARVENP